MNRRDRKIQRGRTLIDQAIFEQDAERFPQVLRYLMGYDSWYAVAVLESRSQEELQLFSLEAWAEWLTLVPESLRLPLQSLVLRAQAGPRYAPDTPTQDDYLLNARDYVQRSIWKAWRREREAEVKSRLERRRSSRSR